MPTLRARGLRKAYGDCVSLDGASLDLAPGRVHALVGENGAGKSTLIRCLCGLVATDAGSVTVDEVELAPGDLRASLAAGVGVVHQHFMLAEALTVAENVVLGAEPRRGLFGWGLDRAAMNERVRALAEARGMPVDPTALVATLGVGERQRVEILKVLHRGATVVLLDEPTAVLSPAEVEGLLATIRAMAAQGAAVLLVTHKLDEVFAVADEITVLRRGRVVLSAEAAATSRAAVTAAVVGDDGHTVPGKVEVLAEEAAAEALAVRGVRGGGAGPFTLTLRAGEVLGVAGVEGNGQRALLELLAGLRPCEAGTIAVEGKDVTREGVAGRRLRGVGFVPEDREGHGLFGELTVAENLALGDVAAATRGGRFDGAMARLTAQRVIARFDVRPTDPDAALGSLSGGNQQKVLVARELLTATRVLLVAQPTRGVDLRAAEVIRAALRGLRAEGVAMVLVSSELDELRALSDRVMVLRRGAVVGEVAASEATDATLGQWMVGG
ncbi:MAG: ATP-binding cassette domain-containing protein [Deltaproteobacteria bacterium]|nr:ATP-binding cassette domain-containing protein [Myxococcales bacterium]MDP3217091.1 ATP-binding cassette domain-containing protein [Deltaproteobacteria bacterium]